MPNASDRLRIALSVMIGQSLIGVAKPSKCSCIPSSVPQSEHISIGLPSRLLRVSREIAPMYCLWLLLEGISPSHLGQTPMSICLVWILLNGFIIWFLSFRFMV